MQATVALPSSDDCEGALLKTSAGLVRVQVPTTEAAQVLVSSELIALQALGESVRADVPFAIPKPLGVTRAGDSRAVCLSEPLGGVIDIDDLYPDALLIREIADALAALHSLPQSFCAHAGLNVLQAAQSRSNVVTLIGKARETGLLPALVEERWQRILDMRSLWDFTPTVIHGDLDVERLRVRDDKLTGVTGWHALSVQDPAKDLAWLFSCPSGTYEAVTSRYCDRRELGGEQTLLRARVQLYRELQLAEWLLHGVHTHDEAIQEDASRMLDGLLTQASIPVVADVQGEHKFGEGRLVELLAKTPEISVSRNDSAVYESLDEDRAFTQKHEPLQ